MGKENMGSERAEERNQGSDATRERTSSSHSTRGRHAGLLSLQRSAGNRAVSDLITRSRSPVLNVIARPGRPLPPALRHEMEDSLGHDFSGVRIHSDGEAADSARSVGAAAYTVGDNIVLGSGTSLNGRRGRQLLAHELAHVIQQRRGPVDGTPAPGGIQISDPSDRFEREADQVSRQLESGSAPAKRPEPVAGGATDDVPQVQRVGDQALRTRNMRRPGRTTRLDDIENTLNVLAGQKHLVSGHSIGGLGASSFGEIRDAVASYTKAVHRGASDELVEAKLVRLEELAITWVNTHRGREDRQRRAVVTQLVERLSEERRSVTEDMAVDRYIADQSSGAIIRGGAANASGGATYEKSATPFHTGMKTDAAEMSDRAAFLNQMIHKSSLIGWSGAGDAREYVATEQLERLGVTPAEQAAIKTYTGKDYASINPATAGSRSWMKAKIHDPKNWFLEKPKDGTFEDLPGTWGKNKDETWTGEDRWVTTLMEEGSLHAAIATRGLAKMPQYRGVTYRGEGLATAPKQGETITFANMYSTSTQVSTAQNFLGQTITSERPFGVLWVYTGGGGSDVSAISAVRGEAEVLVPAGSRYEILEVREVSYMSAPMTGDASQAFQAVQDAIWAGSYSQAAKVLVVRARYIGGGVYAPATATAPAPAADTDDAAVLRFGALVEARRLTREAKKLEPTVTADIKSLAKSRGGRVVGLEHCVKTEQSLSRKLEDRARTRVSSKLSAEDAIRAEAAKVNDVLRYTIVMPSAKYKGLANDVRKEMQTLGGYVAGNYWDAWASADTYKGHNITFTAKDSDDKPFLFELQLHTKDTFATKQEIHGMYEEARAADTSPARKAELEKAMAERWTKVKTPKGQFNKSAVKPLKP